MKLLFASDVHGCLPALQKVIAAFEKHQADKLVFLGDLLYHGPRNPLPEGYNPKEVAALLNSYKTRLLTVRGNCDAEVDQMMLEFPCLADFSQLYVDNHVFYVTHGHLFNSNQLPPLNKNDIFIHGHFHVPMLKKEGDIYIANPNSISLPKQGEASYIIYENHTLTMYRLSDDTIIDTLNLE